MKEIKPLTTLRGVAAMAVVMQHFSATAQLLCAVSIPSLVPHGYMGVDFFFVLSGFIMSYTYLDSFQRVGLRAYPEFLGKRVARVVPLNVVVLLMLMALGAASMAQSGHNIFFASDDLTFDLVANLLMLQGLGIGRNLNGPSWSISTEFAAYLLFPGFIALVFNTRKSVLGLSLSLALVALCWQASTQPRLGLVSETIGFQILRCFSEFALGMASYRLYRHPDAQRLLGTDLATMVLVAAILSCLVLRVDLPVALIAPFLIVSLACNSGRVSRFMSHGTLYFLGVISYSIYLIHNPFRSLGLEALRALGFVSLSPAAALFAALLGSLSVIPFAWIAYRLVEVPGRAAVRAMVTVLGRSKAPAG